MKEQAYNHFLPIDTYIPDGEIQIFANNEMISKERITPFGRKTVVLDYQIKNKNKQEISIRFFGKGKFDLYSFEFKGDI